MLNILDIERSNMTLPQSDFNLSDGELKAIALITLNWAHAEAVLGVILSQIMPLDHEISKIIIHPLDGTKKIKYLLDLVAKIPSLSINKHLIDEIKFAFSNYRDERNIYNHGLILSGDDGSRMAVSLKGRESSIGELSQALEKSKFALSVTARLAHAINFGESAHPLPPRPC